MPFIYKIGERGPDVLREVLDDKGSPFLCAFASARLLACLAGWEEWKEEEDPDRKQKITLSWRSGRFKPSDYASANAHQRFNHFPKTSTICKKARIDFDSE